MTGWVLGGGATEVILVSGVVCVAMVMLLAGENNFTQEFLVLLRD